MFSRNKKELATVSDYIEKKSRLIKKKKKIIRSKITYALGGEHKHYFSQQDVRALNGNARCKVCNMLLSEIRVQKKIENWTPHLKPIHKTPTPMEKQTQVN